MTWDICEKQLRRVRKACAQALNSPEVRFLKANIGAGCARIKTEKSVMSLGTYSTFSLGEGG